MQTGDSVLQKLSGSKKGPPTAETVLNELQNVLKDFESARLSGFSRDERAQYEQLSQHIQENIRDILQ